MTDPHGTVEDIQAHVGTRRRAIVVKALRDAKGGGIGDWAAVAKEILAGLDEMAGEEQPDRQDKQWIRAQALESAARFLGPGLAAGGYEIDDKDSGDVWLEVARDAALFIETGEITRWTDTPAEPARCPSCDHVVALFHTGPEGCRHTVTRGRLDKDMVCPCSDGRTSTEPALTPDGDGAAADGSSE